MRNHLDCIKHQKDRCQNAHPVKHYSTAEPKSTAPGDACSLTKSLVNPQMQSILSSLNESETVNAVAPGFIDTDMTAVLPEAVRTGMTQGIPAGRAGQPEDVAQAVAFFAAEQSSYLTGQVLCVDGGMAM